MIEFKENELILITGASSGIGRATALLCNKLGAKVIAVGRKLEKLQSLKEEAIFPDNILIEPRELAENMETLPNWITALKNKYGKFSGFVHCAGYNITAAFQSFTIEESQKLIDIHYHSALLITKSVVDRRNCEKNCSLVFMSSVFSTKGFACSSLYSGVKGALVSLARSLAKELGSRGIRVNTLSPAWVKTEMMQNYSNNVIGGNVLEEEEKLYPLGVCEAEDIANSIVFLLSNKSKKITGQNIIIDGGRF